MREFPVSELSEMKMIVIKTNATPACNPSTQAAEGGGLCQVQGQSGLQNKFLVELLENCVTKLQNPSVVLTLSFG